MKDGVEKRREATLPRIQNNTEATNAKLDEQTEILESIDKNIAILVDRGR